MEHAGVPLRRSNRTDPFVSVVTVSLDAVDTIGDTLASIGSQRADFEFEHVCVDGGSKDGTRLILDREASRSGRIRTIYEADRGIFDAMNKGLAAALGEYVLFLNADDFLASPRALAAAMHGLSPGARNNPDLIAGHVLMGRPGAHGIWRRRRVPKLLKHLRGWGLYPPHQGLFAKRALLESVGGFNAALRYAADLTQYYDLERRFAPTLRLLNADIAFMRAGGAANSSFASIARGSGEIFRHLRSVHGPMRAAVMVIVKSVQSFGELRYGRLPQQRWFTESNPPAG